MAAALVIILVAGIIAMVLARGIPHISVEFLTTTASVLKGTDGILPAILNTLYVILLTLLIVLPLGVGAAVYLTEYATNRRLIEGIEFTNETLAGIPSILYGLVGMLVFAQTLGFKTCLLSGGLTLVIMNLPTIMRNTQESLKNGAPGATGRARALGLGAGNGTSSAPSCSPAAWTASSPAASWRWAALWAKAPPCCIRQARRRSLPRTSSRPTPPTARPLSVLLYLRAFEDGDFDSAWAIGAVLLVLVLAINLAARLAKNETETEAITEAIIEGLLCLIQPLSSRPKTSTSGMGISRP